VVLPEISALWGRAEVEGDVGSTVGVCLTGVLVGSGYAGVVGSIASEINRGVDVEAEDRCGFGAGQSGERKACGKGFGEID
jgi:hypothetical protein